MSDANQTFFVGREAELEAFDAFLKDPRGQAAVVVGQQGMGKTTLVNEMMERSLDHARLGVYCGPVRYEIVADQSVAAHFARMIIDLETVANAGAKPILSGRPDQWAALANAVNFFVPRGGTALHDLVKALGPDDPRVPADERFMRLLHAASEKMPDSFRAVFVIDPEKYMKTGTADDWARWVDKLPPKTKFVFAQRPDDALASREDFLAKDNVVRIPADRLDSLSETAVAALVERHKAALPISPQRALDAVLRYKGHPFCVEGALKLLQKGHAPDKLPVDPKGIAKEQWKRVLQKKEAVAIFQSYAVLEVAVPDDVLLAVSKVDGIEFERIVEADAFLAGLLRPEADGRRIYHSFLADYIVGRLAADEPRRRALHEAACAEYRKRLPKNDRPDPLAARRLTEHVLALTNDWRDYADCLANETASPLATLGLLDEYESKLLRTIKKLPIDAELGRAITFCKFAELYKIRGKITMAREQYQEALAIYEKLECIEGLARVYVGRGSLHFNSNNLFRSKREDDENEESLRKALAIYEKIEQIDGMAEVYRTLGGHYYLANERDKAEESCRKALAIYERLGDRRGMAIVCGTIGLLCKNRSEFDEAEVHFRNALEVHENLGNLQGLASANGNLGFLYFDRGEMKPALEYCRKAVDHYRQLGAKDMVDRIQEIIGEAERREAGFPDRVYNAFLGWVQK